MPLPMFLYIQVLLELQDLFLSILLLVDKLHMVFFDFSPKNLILPKPFGIFNRFFLAIVSSFLYVVSKMGIKITASSNFYLQGCSENDTI